MRPLRSDAATWLGVTRARPDKAATPLHSSVLNFSPEKLFLVGLIALVVLGPNRLPQAARTLGRLVGRAAPHVGELPG